MTAAQDKAHIEKLEEQLAIQNGELEEAKARFEQDTAHVRELAELLATAESDLDLLEDEAEGLGKRVRELEAEATSLKGQQAAMAAAASAIEQDGNPAEALKILKAGLKG